MNRITTSICAALVLGLTACSGGSQPAPAGTPEQTPTTSATTPVGPITVTDAWAKAVPDLGEHPMTGVFATLTNTTSAPVTITSASNSASPTTEMHETVTQNGRSVMQRVDGGFTIDAGATRELRPGGDHIMVMGMTSPLPPGQVVTVTLTTQDGQTLSFEAVAKTFTGGDEKYHSGTGSGTTTGTPGTPGTPGATGTAPTEASPEHTAPGMSPSAPATSPMASPMTSPTAS